MRSFCEEQHVLAFLEIGKISKHPGIPREAFETAFDTCVGRWADDFRMIAFCLKTQIEGYSELMQGPGDLSGAPASDSLLVLVEMFADGILTQEFVNPFDNDVDGEAGGRVEFQFRSRTVNDVKVWEGLVLRVRYSGEGAGSTTIRLGLDEAEAISENLGRMAADQSARRATGLRREYTYTSPSGHQFALRPQDRGFQGLRLVGMLLPAENDGAVIFSLQQFDEFVEGFEFAVESVAANIGQAN